MGTVAENPAVGEVESPPTIEERRALIERVAASEQFSRSARLRDFLLYVGKQSLKEGCPEIHEHEIGARVFGRPASYDRSADNIVRVNATELRKRIESYFESTGANEHLIFDIPRGGYRLVFHRRPAERAESAAPSQAESAHESENAESSPRGDTRPSRSLRRFVWPVVSLCLATSCVALYVQNRAMRKAVYPWQSERAVAQFWTGFLGSNRETDIVTEDSTYLLLQSITKQRFSLQDYLNRDYVSRIQVQDSNGDLRSALSLIASKDLGRADDAQLVQRIMALDPLGSKLHPYSAREYTPALASAHNMILVGGELSNPWVELFDDRMNFISDSKDVNARATVIRNRTPAAGEQQIYAPIFTEKPTIEYCSVAYLPNPNHNGRILVIEGTSWAATDAGVGFLLSEDQLAAFQKKIRATELPYFNVLLKTTNISNTPLVTTIEAYRTYPNLQ